MKQTALPEWRFWTELCAGEKMPRERTLFVARCSKIRKHEPGARWADGRAREWRNWNVNVCWFRQGTRETRVQHFMHFMLFVHESFEGWCESDVFNGKEKIESFLGRFAFYKKKILIKSRCECQNDQWADSLMSTFLLTRKLTSAWFIARKTVHCWMHRDFNSPKSRQVLNVQTLCEPHLNMLVAAIFLCIKLWIRRIIWQITSIVPLNMWYKLKKVKPR